MGIFDGLKNKKKKKNKIPKEILDRLPAGAKVKQIIIGPKFVMKLVIYLLVGYLILSTVVSSLLPEDMQIGISEAVDAIKKDEVEEVTVIDNQLFLTLKENGKVLIASKEGDSSFVEILQNEGVDLGSLNVRIENRQGMKMFGDILNIFLMVGLPILVLVWFMRKSGGMGGGGGMFGFGKSNAKLFVKGKLDLTFKDVAGVKEAKDDLQEVVDFLKNPKKYQKMGARTPKGVLLVGPAGVGKCVTGDTLVWTNKGLLEIQDIPKYYFVRENGLVEGARVNSFTPETLFSTDSIASHWYDLGESDTYRITTDLGHEIEGTPEHPLVVMGEDGNLRFKKTEEIKAGDYLPLKTNSQMFGSYRRLDKEQAYILGLLTGDGGMTIKDRICFTTADRELLIACKNYFQTKYSYPMQKTKSRKYDYVITSAQIKTELLESGLSENYSRNKKIPEQIMMAPKEQVVAFLQGLFDTDGSVYKTGKVEFSTSSKKLAKQASALLLNLGIMHKFRTKRNNQYVNSYIILISGGELVHFSQQVGFRLSRKQEKLNSYLSKIKLRTNVDLFPAQGIRILRLWRYLVEAGKKPSKYVDKNFHKQICRYAAGGRKPSRKSVKLFLEACVGADPEIHTNDNFRFLQLLINSGLFFDKVSKVEKSRGKVYDFTVPETHSFVGNGFISHNTLLAKAVAGEANVPFFSMAGSEFMEMLVGVGASRVRDLFSTAKKAGKAIIFIDEIDAIGRMRGGLGGQSHGEREQTLNQILVEMDGFEANTTVIVLAATNRGDLLDPALLRPGRFDRRVVLEMPDIADRKDILAIHAKGKPFGKDVNWDRVAESTVGFSGADLENMLNEAAIKAAREDKTEIDRSDIEEASLKVKMGSEKRRVQTDEDKKMTAYHEAGHAIVNFAEKLDPVDRISIVSRGMALGFTLIPPSKDRIHETKSNLVKQMAMAMGGRAAEEIVFGDMTTGASSDIQQATKIAREMVTSWGMSKLGPVNLGSQITGGEYGNSYLEPSQVSDGMKAEVDTEIQRFVDEAHKEAINVLKKYRMKMDKIAKVLVERETLGREDFEKLMR